MGLQSDNRICEGHYNKVVKEQQTTVAAIVVIALLSDFWSISVLNINYPPSPPLY